MELTLSELLDRIKNRSGSKEELSQVIDRYYSDFLHKGLLENVSLQDAFQISSKEMELLYNQAYTHYQDNEFEQASSLFRFLVLLCPYASHSWMGLAASLHLAKAYEEALKCYVIVTLLDPKNVLPFLYASECHLALGQNNEAIEALEQGIERSDDPEWTCQTRMKVDKLKKDLYV